MTLIPQEILDHIIGSISDWSFLNNAPFVSRTFHQILLPYKFRSLNFELRCSREELPYVHRTIGIPIPKFCLAIIAGDAHALSLAPLVKELSIFGWSGRFGYGNDLIPEPFEKVIQALLSFRNLTTLSMEKCVTTPAIMKQLGKLVQLQSLRTYRCEDEQYDLYDSYGALSNLQSLRKLECGQDWLHFRRHLVCISMNSLQNLKTGDWEVFEALAKTNPPVQLKELHIQHFYVKDHSLLWNYLARVTSLTHLSIPDLHGFQPGDGIGPPSLVFSFPELQHLYSYITSAPYFADQPMKEMEIWSESRRGGGMDEVRQHWQGVVFPHVKKLEMRIWKKELEKIPIEFWKEFLPNVNQVTYRTVKMAEGDCQPIIQSTIVM